MRTVRVISEFVDKNDLTRLYKPGEVVSFDAERANDMVRRELAVIIDDDNKSENARPKRGNKDNSDGKQGK